MAERIVSVRLNARVEQYLAAMKSAAAATGLTTAQLNNMSRVGGQLSSVGGSLTRYVSLPLAAVGVVAVHSAMQWETAFAQMQGLASVTADEVDGLKESVLDLAGETAQSPQDLANGLYLAASAGLDSAAAMDVVSMAAHAAAAGMGSTATVVDLLTSVLGSYGAGNITAARAADILTAAVKEGKAAPDEMAQSLGRVLPIAASMGITFEETAASVAFLTNAGLDTDEAVTAFRGTMLALLDPTAQARKALTDAGTSVEEVHAAISQDGLLGALTLLREHGFVPGSEALSNLIEDNRALVGATALLADASGQLVPIMDAVANSSGAMGDAFGVVADTDAFKMKQALAELKVAMISIGEVILPIAADAGSAIADLAGWFAELPGPVQAAAVAFGALLTVAGPLTSIAGKILTNWTQLAGVFGVTESAASRVGKVLGAVGLIAGTAYVAWKILGQGHLNASGHIDTASDALSRETTAAFNNAVAAGQATTKIDALAIANEALSRAIVDAADPALTNALATLNVAGEDTLDVILRLGHDTNDLAEQQALLQDSFGLTAEQAQLFTSTVTRYGFTEQDITQELRDGLAMTDEQIMSVGNSINLLSQYAVENSGEVDAMARSYLDAQVLIGGTSREVVLAAEAIAGSRLETGNAVDVYEEFLYLLTLLPPAEAEAALGATDIGTGVAAAADAATDAAPAMTNLGKAIIGANDVAASTIDTMSDLEEAFDDASRKAGLFSDALHGIIDPSVGLQEAEEAVWAAAIKFTDAIDENSRSLDISSEAGQTNRDVIEGWASEITGLAEAQIAHGDSILEVTRAWNHNSAALVQAAVDAGFTESEVRDLIATYNLTPTGVNTVIQLYGQKVAKQDVEDYIASMDNIPPDVLTEVEAAIDQGAYGYALFLLQQLAAPGGGGRQSYVVVHADTQPAYDEIRNLTTHYFGVAVHVQPTYSNAAGSYVPAHSNILTTAGEEGDEVILPLTNRARMAQLLAMSQVGPRVLAAFGIGTAAVTAGGGGFSAAQTGGGAVQYNTTAVTVNMPPGSNGDDVIRALRKWQRQSGPLPLAVR